MEQSQKRVKGFLSLYIREAAVPYFDRWREICDEDRDELEGPISMARAIEMAVVEAVKRAEEVA